MNPQRQPWSGHDMKVLADYYPEGGSVEVNKHLEVKRSTGAINEMARRNNIQRKDHARWQRVPTNEHIDAAIRRAYESGVLGEVKRCAKKINRPYGWVKYRAACMGLRNSIRKEPKWTAEEDELLAELSGKSLEYISKRFRMKGYRRTMSAIQSRIMTLGLDTSDPDSHNASDLARLLGFLDTHPVLRWIEKGWLPAKKAAHMTITDKPQNWRIKRKDVRAFIRDNPHLVDLRRVDRFWFIDLLANPYEQNKKQDAA